MFPPGSPLEWLPEPSLTNLLVVISVSGLARVVANSNLIDEKKPSNRNTLCEWQLAKEDPLTMVATYYSPSGPVGPGSVVHVSGELKFMPGDSEGEADARSLHEVASAKDADLVDVTPPVTRIHKIFIITVQVPPTGRFSNLRNPVKGTIVSVRGILSSVTNEEVAEIDLEAVTFSFNGLWGVLREILQRYVCETGPLLHRTLVATDSTVHTLSGLETACVTFLVPSSTTHPPTLTEPSNPAMALSVRNIGVELDELQCNNRRYGLHSDNRGSSVSLSWTSDRYTIYRDPREAHVVEEYSFTNQLIKHLSHASSASNMVVFQLSNELYEHGEWKNLAGDQQGATIRLTIIARLMDPSDDDSEVDEQEDRRAWQRLIQQLSKLPCCQRLELAAMRSLVCPPEQKVYIDSFANVERKSMARIQTQTGWLNDELVNAGLRFIEQDLAHSDYNLCQRTLFLGSHWWPQLDKGKGKSVVFHRFAKSVKKDILGLDYVIAPINMRANHWILCVICYPGNVARMAHMNYVANLGDTVQVTTTNHHWSLLTVTMAQRKDLCTILLLDSMETNRYEYLHYFRVIREYLQVVASVKIGKPVKVLSREVPPGWLEDCVVKVPQQTNGWDCGLYVLNFARQFVALGDKVLRAKATDDNVVELWERCSGTDARSEFRRRLEEASELWLQNQRL
ncbi:hypothetical protein FRC06_009124 [Ceratobasidium sp. 370]|nr:hypothetical protein FRC06_009124 [Ceratobasidium sp. 370]